MTGDEITIRLEGTVSIRDLSKALGGFSSMTDALSTEIGNSAQVEWMIEGLQKGSATVTIRPQSADLSTLPRLMGGITTVVNSIEKGEPIPYSGEVRRYTERFTSVLASDNITGLRVSLPDGITRECKHVETRVEAHDTQAFGVLSGTVKTLTSRRGTRFVLYDDLFDRAIRCDLSHEQTHLVSNAWTKRVRVTGIIHRRAGTAMPFRITDITAIEKLDCRPGGLRRAVGALQSDQDTELPEVTIRRLRDES